MFVKENLEKIKKRCQNLGISYSDSDEYMFTINCVDYFYYQKNIGDVDINDGFVDGSNDGGIDFIYTDDEKIYLIQGKSTNSLDINAIRDLLYKIKVTITDLNNKNFGKLNARLITSYYDIYDRLDNPEICIVLFTNTIIDENFRARIEHITKSEDFSDYEVIIYDGEEIENRILNVDDSASLVSKGQLKLDSTKNYLTYLDEKGAIFSIKASSLKELYIRESDRGLFGYNLREHITQKNVDSAIDKTISNNKDEFWFYNNGITIGCSDYYVDGNMLKLENFSIINGAQTTSNIGKHPKVSNDYDFSLVCKVIKSENSLDDEFIRNISEASNSQKPIKFRDLKSNSPEQKLLQKGSLESKYPLSIEIKRGVKPDNYKRVESWERVSNEYIAQLILSVNYLCPGSARSQKSDIFSKEATYNKIFSKDKIKKYSYNAIHDFVYLGYLYDLFKIEYTKQLSKEIELSKNEVDKVFLLNKKAICNNGKFAVLGILGYLYKREVMDKKDLNDPELYEAIIIGDFTKGYDKDDYHERVEYLFKFLVDRLTKLYEKNGANYTSQSNFFKGDRTFVDIILPDINRIFSDEFDKEKLEKNLVIFKN